jgi:hypothetical protein
VSAPDHTKLNFSSTEHRRSCTAFPKSRLASLLRSSDKPLLVDYPCSFISFNIGIFVG